ncbi:CHRD domain-containing protein [Gluconacetobacter sacchari]|uniref:CHRD domain-containing protein n=2 Tax=Gluconacetobacter sacchari TaxID=92759 RepID=A0A7W4IB70_9PROT|nr:CHRD domain-containing protein [Gluconacetobacter sacchari]MBB2159666.1 CHRD domain-containing protein [Gluconacetobacter sacchari]GBQ27484.1 hypothetical protein AA12717_2697 [Gluconacetobacter sacchari DSM 12717]
MRRSLLFFSLLTAAPLAAMPPAVARTVQIVGHFVPGAGVTTKPAGTVTGTLNEKRNLVLFSMSWSGLSGPVMAAHFHGPAAPGQDAGVMVPIKGPYSSPLHGAVIMTPEQVAALRAGRVYINLHTSAYPDGEARAQLQIQ